MDSSTSSRCSSGVCRCICGGCGFGCRCVLVEVCSCCFLSGRTSDLSLVGISECREVSKSLDSRQKKVGASSYGGEGRQTGDFFPERAPRDFEFQRAVLVADDRIALV